MNTLKPWQVQPLSNIRIRFPSHRLTNDAISTKFCRSAMVRIFSQISPQSVPTVTTPYTELKCRFIREIEQGFGSNGLGIPSILEVPGYTPLRRNLLQLAPRLANLPDEVKKKLEDLYSRYNIGWSHGKEQLESGKPHLMKGSYYINPILDAPKTELSHVESIKWFLSENEGLLQILLRSRCHKGHLLYYFPSLQRDEKLRFPKEVNIHGFMVPDESISFGDYTEKLLDKCYDLK